MIRKGLTVVREGEIGHQEAVVFRIGMVADIGNGQIILLDEINVTDAMKGG